MAKKVVERLLGEVAIRAGLLTRARLEECLALQERRRGKTSANAKKVPRIGEILAHKGYLTRAQVTALLAGKYARRRARFGEIAVRQGAAQVAQVEAAAKEQRRRRRAGEPALAIGQILRDQGALTAEAVRKVLAAQGKSVARCGTCRLKLTIQDFVPGVSRCKRCDAVLVPERAAGAARAATVAREGADVVTRPKHQRRLAKGERIEGYEIQALLGFDVTGGLYRATELARGRTVAFKLLDPGVVKSKAALKELLALAQKSAELAHPAIKKLYAVGRAGEHGYLAMEYVQGDSLRQVLARAGKLPVPMVIKVATQLVDGLIHAAGRGLVHGDIRPANLIVDATGQLKISGFGVPVDKGGNLRLFAQDRRDGGACYLAPELVVSGAVVDSRADVFGLGCTLYHLLSGRPPLRGRSPVDVLLQMSEGGIPPLRKLAPKAPPELLRIITQMVELEPIDRYQSLYQLERELQVVASGIPGLEV